MPSRKIPKNYRNVTGVQALTKGIGVSQFESTLERDFLSLLEFSPDVVSIEVQPIRLQWRDDQGKLRHYVPDVLVHFREELGRKPWLCEVKYRPDIKKYWSELRPKFGAAIRYCREHGWRFRLITEIEVRTPFLQNAKFLLPYLRQRFSEQQKQTVLACLESFSLSPAEILQRLSADQDEQLGWIPVIWHLVAMRQVATDLHEPLTMAVSLSLNHE